MSTSLINAEILLSKELGDYWASTTTSDGAAGGTTLIDTALKAKANDWIDGDREMYDMLTEGTASAAVGTITVISVANPTVVTISAVHGLTTGDIVAITGSNSTPVIDGIRTVTVLTTTTFTVPVNVTVAGTAGTVTAGTLYEERKISSLSNTLGTLTVLPHGGGIGSGIDYRIHRLFSASEKRRALVHAAKAIYPHLFIEIRDESMVSGNWLKDGALLKWTTSTDPTYWTASTVTVTKTTTLPYFKHSTQSAKLSGTAGFMYQDIALWGDLKRLAGKAITFTAQGHCGTASCLRLGILYDGTNLTYSSYHDASGGWTEDNNPLSVAYTIDDNPTDIEFRVYQDVSSVTSYVNDLRVIGPDGARIYIGDLGLAQNTPHQVLVEPSNYAHSEPWLNIHNYKVDSTNGYLYPPDNVSTDLRLRILGNGYLDFYDTSDVVGTDWADTIALDSPQTEILVAQAAVYLCQQMIVPNYTSGEGDRWARALAYWQAELRERISRFGMLAPSATVHWR